MIRRRAWPGIAAALLTPPALLTVIIILLARGFGR